MFERKVRNGHKIFSISENRIKPFEKKPSKTNVTKPTDGKDKVISALGNLNQPSVMSVASIQDNISRNNQKSITAPLSSKELWQCNVCSTINKLPSYQCKSNQKNKYRM